MTVSIKVVCHLCILEYRLFVIVCQGWLYLVDESVLLQDRESYSDGQFIRISSTWLETCVNFVDRLLYSEKRGKLGKEELSLRQDRLGSFAKPSSELRKSCVAERLIESLPMNGHRNVRSRSEIDAARQLMSGPSFMQGTRVYRTLSPLSMHEMFWWESGELCCKMPSFMSTLSLLHWMHLHKTSCSG